MKRKKNHHGTVHFAGAHDRTLCGELTFDLDFTGHRIDTMTDTGAVVTCPDCARLYCQVKDAPWNELDAGVLSAAVYNH